jgi:hypothetical protein
MGIEFGHPFIPPFSNLEQGTNDNLELTTIVGKAFGLGYSGVQGAYATPTSTSPDAPFYTGVITDGGPVQYYDPQGVTSLWLNLYGSHYQLTQAEWNTNSAYYMDLYNSNLSTFVTEFLKYAHDIITNLTPKLINEAMDDASSQPATVNTYNDVIGFLPNIDQIIFSDRFTILTDLDGILTTIVSDDETRWQKSFLGTSDNVPEPLYNSTPTQTTAQTATIKSVIPQSTLDLLEINGTSLTDGQIDVLAMWEIFLFGTDIEIKTNSMLTWAVLVMQTMLNVLDASIEEQANRVTVLTTAQEKATSAMAAISFTVVTKQSDVTGQTSQNVQNGWVAIYRAQRNVLQSYSQMQSSAVNNTNSAQEQQSSLISQILDTMDSLIQGIFLG